MPGLYLLLLTVFLSGCTALGNPVSPAAAEKAVVRNAEDWFAVGNTHVDSGELDEAERAYLEALEQGAHPRARHNLGLVRLRLGIADLRQAREQRPTDAAVEAATREYLRLLLQGGY